MFRAEVEAAGGLPLLMDVTDSRAIDAAYAAVIERFGTVDVLVNNAGMRQRDLYPPHGRVTTLETSDADWERMFAVNVFGALKVTRRFIQPMLERQRGSIITCAAAASWPMRTAVATRRCGRTAARCRIWRQRRR